MSEITKRAFASSLKKMLAKRPLEKIRVIDITEDCGVNRQTFYYHFKDIYDLAEWACLQEAAKVIKENKTHDTWQEGMLQIFYTVRENKPLIMNVYRCVDREQVERYLKPLIDHLLLKVVEEQSADMTVRQEDKEFIASVYSYAFVGLMLDWIKNDMRENPEQLISKLALVIQDTFTDALERFRIDKTLSKNDI